jgi:hypothetical protein
MARNTSELSQRIVYAVMINAPGSVATNNGIHHFTSSVIYTSEQQFCGRECCQYFLCSILIVLARDGYHALLLQFMRAEVVVDDIDNH